MNSDKTLFTSLALDEPIQRALKDLNFEYATPIQTEAIPLILSGSRDLIGLAQTGTGKTAAFSLPVLQKLDPQDRHVQALILCPTRELCMQITRDMDSFSKYRTKTNVVAVYGGSSMRDQIRSIRKGAQIVVGTPGRVRDLVERGELQLDQLRWLVLDEADDMLDKGFKDDLDAILNDTPKEKQTLLFSATISPWIEKVAQQRMHNPQEIKMASKNKGADTVEHQYVCVHAKDRYAALRRLLDVNPDVYGIVFCRTRRQTKEVAAQLISDNYLAEAIHGDVDQRDRSRTMERFRSRDIQLLVATDVAARGIDVNELTHVINYELPDSPETYVHRSGRTGRAGNTGISLTIIHMREHGKLGRIERIMKRPFTQIDVPTGDEICRAQIMSLVNKVKNAKVDQAEMQAFLPAIYKALDGLSKEEVIQHFVSEEFHRFVQHYSNAQDISTQHQPKSQSRSFRDSRDSDRRNDRRSKKKAKANVRFGRYEINVGRHDGFNPKALFQLVNQNKKLKGMEIGSIRVGGQYTTFEADENFHMNILTGLNGERFKNIPLKVLVKS